MFFHKIYKFFTKNILYKPLSQDSELFNILQKEKYRQLTSLELIASENFTSKSVLQANGTIFTNKYSEGYPHKRYYGGNEYIDQLEELCQERALQIFNLDKNQWSVNVQSYSGSPANFSVYTALLNPGDTIMGLDLPSGGHLTHGYQTPTKKISSSSIYFNSKSYTVGPDSLIDYIDLEKRVDLYKPRLIIVGASAYTRDFNYATFRKIADKYNSYLMADIAHVSGLISANLLNSPFQYCDVVTTTTHKTLRGPRGALIYSKTHLSSKIDFAVFPSNQGGPHNNTIAAITTALKQVNTLEYKQYAQQVVKNAQVLSQELQKYNFDILTGGTDNHIVLVNLKSKGLTGSKFEKIAEMCNVSLNKNTIPSDTSALNPSGIRLGTPAMTSRGFVEKDIAFIAYILNEISAICSSIQSNSQTNKLSDFMDKSHLFLDEINKVKQKVINYTKKFPLPT
jgi:glycine hydroxymethyltransferase